MKKIYFAVSDIHGCYSALKAALDEAGFQKGNANHILVVVGDAFDRGDEQKELYEFLLELDELEQLEYVLGNHDFMMINLSSDPALAVMNYDSNGLKQTIHQIFGIKKMVSKFNYIKTVSRSEGYRKMAGWLRSKSLFFETEDYVFAHAGIPFNEQWRLWMTENDTWGNTTYMMTEDLSQFIGDKTLICGHWHAIRMRIALGHIKDNLEEWDKPENHSIFHSPFENNNFIAIDGCTNYSGVVNVLVVMQEEPKKENG